MPDVLLDETTETVDVLDLVIPDAPIPCEGTTVSEHDRGQKCGDLADWIATAVCARGHRSSAYLCHRHAHAATRSFASGRWRGTPPCFALIVTFTCEPLG